MYIMSLYGATVCEYSGTMKIARFEKKIDN